MIGVLLGLLCAFSTATEQTLTKKLSSVDAYSISFIQSLPSLPILAILVSVFSTWAIPGLTYWILLLCVVVPLEVLLSILFIKAVKLAPLSQVAPLTSFSSLFIVLFAYVVLHEVPTTIGLIGIVLIIFGTFFISKENGKSLYMSVAGLLRSRGCLYALLWGVVASITTIMTKVLFQYAPPLLSAFYTTVFITLYITPLLVRRRGSIPPLNGVKLGSVGVAQALTTATHFVGLSFMSAAYFISIKRTSMAISVIFGLIFFGETHIVHRFVGSAIMLFGVGLIAFG